MRFSASMLEGIDAALDFNAGRAADQFTTAGIRFNRAALAGSLRAALTITEDCYLPARPVLQDFHQLMFETDLISNFAKARCADLVDRV